MEKVVTTVFKTIDGKVFQSESEAIAHENNIANVRVFEICAGPDLTEGRHGPQFKGYLLVHAQSFHGMFAEDWCYKKYKSKVEFCMGVYGSNAIIWNWDCKPSNKPWSETKESEIIDRIEERFVKKIWS